MIARLTSVLVCAGLATTLAGCASTSPYRDATNAVPPVSEVIVHEALRRPGGSRRIYIQNGRFTPRAAIDRFTTNCYFSVGQTADGELPASIRPGTFTTGRTVHKVLQHAAAPAAEEPLLVAAAEGVRLAGVGGGGAGGYSPFPYGTVMKLASEHQPAVKRLTCLHLRDPHQFTADHFPNREDMQRTLADIVELRFADSKSSDNE